MEDTAFAVSVPVNITIAPMNITEVKTVKIVLFPL